MPLSALTQVSFGGPSGEIDAERLADLPVHGVAAPYVGVAGDALVVAGGTNFPNAPPWKNGTKAWHRAAYVLPSPDAEWLQGFQLSKPLAYGVSLTIPDGVLCIGGCDNAANVDDVFILRWEGKRLTEHAMPSLPHPTSCSAGALIGSRVYVAGGQSGPDPTSGPSHSYFWTMDLDDQSPQWRDLPTWPGPERFYAVAGSDGKSFFLFSGIRRIVGERGAPKLEYLKDAYAFNPAVETWTRLADLPHPNAAVAAPAPYIDSGLFLLGRGADGSGTELPLEQRPPFGRENLRYDVATNIFEPSGALPFGLAAVVTAKWRGAFVIPSGETRPGVRARTVWSIRPESLSGGAARRTPTPRKVVEHSK